MSKRSKTFGQFRANKEGIETVVGYQYRYINKEDIVRGNYQPAQIILKLDWVSKNDFCRAYEHAEKIFCQNQNTATCLNSEQHAQMMDEFEHLPWKKNSKGNHVAVTDKGVYITVFKDLLSGNRLKWVVEDVFASSSYKSLEYAKSDAFKHYFVSNLEG